LTGSIIRLTDRYFGLELKGHHTKLFFLVAGRGV